MKRMFTAVLLIFVANVFTVLAQPPGWIDIRNTPGMFDDVTVVTSYLVNTNIISVPTDTQQATIYLDEVNDPEGCDFNIIKNVIDHIEVTFTTFPTYSHPYSDLIAVETLNPGAYTGITYISGSPVYGFKIDYPTIPDYYTDILQIEVKVVSKCIPTSENCCEVENPPNPTKRVPEECPGQQYPTHRKVVFTGYMIHGTYANLNDPSKPFTTSCECICCDKPTSVFDE